MLHAPRTTDAHFSMEGLMFLFRIVLHTKAFEAGFPQKS